MLELLPPTLQRKIFNKLENMHELLTCRLVHTTWNKLAKSVLEERSLLEWTKWDDTCDSRTKMKQKYLPALYMTPWNSFTSSSSAQLLWNHSNLNIQNKYEFENPFPTNSLKTSFNRDMNPGCCSDPMSENQQMMIRNVFLHYGHFLSVVHLQCICIALEELREIIGSMENLRVFSLRSVNLRNNKFCVIPFSDDDTESQHSHNLPALTSLTHLSFGYCSRFLGGLLIKSYKNQLQQLETDYFQCSSNSFNFPLLTHLKLVQDIKLNLQLLPEDCFQIENLQYLSVRQTSKKQIYTLIELIHSIDALPKSLVKLHLDVPVTDDGAITTPICNPRITFPLIKEFWTNFCHNEKRAKQFGKWILPKFPELRVLKLRVFFGIFVCSDSSKILQVMKAIVRAGKFWDVCSKLQKIMFEDAADSVTYFELYNIKYTRPDFKQLVKYESRVVTTPNDT